MRALSALSTIALLALAVPAASVEALPVATGTAEDIPAEGLYTDACLPTSTCDATIRRVGPDRYRLEWAATDRMGQEVYCRFAVDLALGSIDNIGANDPAYDVRWTNVLVGTVPGSGGQKVMALAMPGSRLFLRTRADICPGVKRPDGFYAMSGFYDPVGDE